MPMAKRAKKKAKKPAPTERQQLVARLSEALGIPAAEVELRALRELAGRLPPPAAPGRARPAAGGMPQRLFLEIDGYGLPLEVIDLPATVGSSRRCTVWINAPRVETRHLQITRGEGGYVVEDLDTEHGTFMNDRRVQRRVVEHGDEFRLAGYVRVRAELR
jgi:hypothetical protein